MTKISLAILIPTLTERAALCERLQSALYKQIDALNVHDRVVMLTNVDNREKTTGEKRNELIRDAVNIGAQYVSFFDDDDYPNRNYIKHSIDCIDKGFDVCELWGNIFFSGKKGKPFHHSLEYSEWKEDGSKYMRMPNHLNTMKLELIKDIKFREQNFGEDAWFSIDIHKAGLLKTMHQVDEVTYLYFTGQKNTKGEQDAIKSVYL